MFYLIYLFYTLILLINFANSNENPEKVTWACANENCDKPLFKFKTVKTYVNPDSNLKLKFEAKKQGSVFKQPVSKYDYYFAEIEGERGYIHKSWIQQTGGLLSKLEFRFDEEDPFLPKTKSDVNPSKVTVVDGTTFPGVIFNEEIKSTPSHNNYATPPLNNDIKFEDNSKSTQTDSVDVTNSAHANHTDSDLNANYNTLNSDNIVSGSFESNNGLKTSVLKSSVPSSEEVLNSETLNVEKKTVISDDRTDSAITVSEGIGSVTALEIDDDDDNSNGSGALEGKQTASSTENPQIAVVNETMSSGDNADSTQPLPHYNIQKEPQNDNTDKVILKDEQQPNDPNNYNRSQNENLSNISSNLSSELSASTNNSDNSVTVKESKESENYVNHESSITANASISSDKPLVDAASNDLFSQPSVETSSSSNDNTQNVTTEDEGYHKSEEPSIPSNAAEETKESENYVNHESSVTANASISSDKPLAEAVSNDSFSQSSQHSGSTENLSTSNENPENVITKDDGHDKVEKSSKSAKPVEESENDLNRDASTTVNTGDTSGDNLTPQPSLKSEAVGTMSPNMKVQQEYAQSDTPYNVKDASASDDLEKKPAFPNNQPSSPYYSFIYSNQQKAKQKDTEDQSASKKTGDSVELRNESSKSPDTDEETVPSAEHSPTFHESSSAPQFSSDSIPSQPNVVTEIPQSANLYDYNEKVNNNVETTTSTPQNGDFVIQNEKKSDDNNENEQKEINPESLLTPGITGTVEEPTNLFSPVSSLFSSLQELFTKSKLEHEDKGEPSDNDPEKSSQAPNGYCYESDSCGGLERPIGGEDQPDSFLYKQYRNVDLFKSSVPLSFNSIMYICITSVVILLFSLGYYYIFESQGSSHIIERVNKLSKELFETKKERDTLEDQLLKIKESCSIMDSSKIKQDSKLTFLQKALEESESSRSSLEETVIRLEKEIETLMDQGMEMHKLLSETISDEERSQMLLANIDELKESLSGKLSEIVALTNQLDKKNEEIQLMQIDVRNANDRLAEYERKFESCKSDTEETFTKKLQDLQQQNIKLQQVLEEKGLNIAKLESELAKTKVDRDSAEARASSAEAGLQSAHSVGAGEARQAWLDSTSVRATLITANKTNETLQNSIAEISCSNKLLHEKVSSLTEELSALNLKYENVEKDKVNALTKLQVLSDYFKEKESKLQEELGMKESLWLQKESEDHTIYEQMKSLREEIASYKAQNDKLKSEILEQEASYKVQIANEEQKSYDNWVALRQAERKVKELQMESAHFRNRLTQLETNNQSVSESLNPNGLEKSSFGAPSPPFMMLPLPPTTDFFPLPPPPIHPTASRPPPLGRISSPQLSGEMLPPPPLVPFDMLPPSSTPPPSLPLYKAQPRPRQPLPKDSPPSNYSSESVNEKSTRRRRR